MNSPVCRHFLSDVGTPIQWKPSLLDLTFPSGSRTIKEVPESASDGNWETCSGIEPPSSEVSSMSQNPLFIHQFQHNLWPKYICRPPIRSRSQCSVTCRSLAGQYRLSPSICLPIWPSRRARGLSCHCDKKTMSKLACRLSREEF